MLMMTNETDKTLHNIPDGGDLFQDIPVTGPDELGDDMLDYTPDEAERADALEEEEGRAETEKEIYDGYTNPGDGLGLYLKLIGEQPLLTAEEEVKLGTMIQNGTPEEQEYAKAEMVSRNLRYVVSVARRYVATGMSFDDLIQEGNLGLIKATEKYDPTSGNRFTTYATWWIRQSITRAIADKARNIRLPVHMSEKLRKLRMLQSEYEKEGKPVDKQAIAAAMEMEESQLEALMEITFDTVSMDTPVGEENDATLSDFIPDSRFGNPEETAMENDLANSVKVMISCLTDRERQVIEARFGLNGKRAKTLKEVGNSMGVTRERIRQIEAKAIRKMKNPKRSLHLKDYLY